MPRGGSVAVQISSTVHGTPGTIALSLPTAAPAAGVTASLTRTSLDHVDSTTLVLSAKSDAALTPDVGGTGVPVPMVVASGSAGSVTHTASLLFHVTAPAASDFSIVVTPDAEIVPTGSTGAAYSVQTSLVNGSADAITLSTTTLPAGVSAFADHNPVPAGETALVTLLAAPTARLGQFNFSIVGTGAGGVSHSAPSSGTVLLANDFHLAVTPMRAVSVAGAGSTLQATYSIATAVVSGSSEPVTLSVHGLPPHATASFSPGSTITSSGGSATLTVTADSTATSSTGSLTVVGTSASQPVGYSQSVAFAVDLPPTASVDAPANGSQVSGTVAISASAHAGEGSSLASLTLEIDGATPAGAATATSSPLHFSWDTTQTSNGSHTLAVAATDADGATTKSGAVTVTVANAPVSTSPSVNGSGGDTSKGGGCATGPDFAAAAGGVALLFLRRRRRTVF